MVNICDNVKVLNAPEAGPTAARTGPGSACFVGDGLA